AAAPAITTAAAVPRADPAAAVPANGALSREAAAATTAPLTVTIIAPTLNVAEAKPSDAERERQQLALAHTAQWQAEKAQCSTHVSQLLGGRTITYADLAAMKGVDKLDNGRLRTPRLKSDDGGQLSLLVDTHGCIVNIRRY
ncbi:MAG: hypothetical protein ACREVL_17795, partial [Solimonas sp.]